MNSGRTLLQSLHHWSEAQPDKVLHTFVDDNGDEVERVTYRQLLVKSGALAAQLLAPKRQGGAGLQLGDRCLLVFPPSIDFIVAFYACLRAGVIAVPCFPPDPRKAKKELYMFTAIQSSSGANVALTNSTYNYVKKVAGIKDFFGGGVKWPDLLWIVTNEITAKLAGAEEFPTATPSLETPAFLQFTSGSTSEPKGVVITHGNLAHNLDIIVTNLQAKEDTVVVSWLPLYHDMGLIGSWLGCLFCGGSGVYMSPVSFIRNPPLWMEMISKHRGTHMQAPNFAYGLCARKFLAKRPQPTLDLSCVRHMINAAEPIHWIDVENFYAVFEQSGLPRGVVFPTYGLAEHTVFVCSNGKQLLKVDKAKLESERRVVQVPDGVEMVGCGFPAQAAGVQVVIVDPSTDATCPAAALEDDRVGEIWVRSPSRAQGYWGAHLQDKSREDFGGQLLPRDGAESEGYVSVPEASEQGFLRTGDLGFLHHGELFVCGRLKDLIIIRGRNIYPQDIERTAEDQFSGVLRGGCSAAFSVPTKQGEESLHLVAEVADPSAVDGPSLVDQIRQAVSRAQGVALSGVYLIQPRTAEKTTSGKIARQWCRRAMLTGTLSLVHEWFDDSTAAAPTDEAIDGAEEPTVPTHAAPQMDVKAMSDQEILDVVLQTIAVDVLKVTVESMKDDTRRPVSELGMDSMEGMALLELLQVKLGCTIPGDILFEEETTLESLVPVVRAGGKVVARTSVMDLVKVMANPAPEKLSEKEMDSRKHAATKKASWQTGAIDPKLLTAEAPLKPKDLQTVNYVRSAFGLCNSLVPAVGLALLLALAAQALTLVVAGGDTAAGVRVPTLVVCLLAGLAGKSLAWSTLNKRATDCRWRTALLTFYSPKLVFDAPLNPREKYLIASTALGSTASCKAHVLLSAAHRFVFGFSPVGLLPRGASTDAKMLAAMLGTSVGLKGAKQATTAPLPKIGSEPSAAEARSVLKRGHSVVWCAGGGTLDVGQSREMVEVAMRTGALLLPAITYETSTGSKHGRSVVGVAYGDPVIVPHTSTPHPGLVNNFAESFVNAHSALHTKLAALV